MTTSQMPIFKHHKTSPGHCPCWRTRALLLLGSTRMEAYLSRFCVAIAKDLMLGYIYTSKGCWATVLVAEAVKWRGAGVLAIIPWNHHHPVEKYRKPAQYERGSSTWGLLLYNNLCTQC